MCIHQSIKCYACLNRAGCELPMQGTLEANDQCDNFLWEPSVPWEEEECAVCRFNLLSRCIWCGEMTHHVNETGHCDECQTKHQTI